MIDDVLLIFYFVFAKAFKFTLSDQNESNDELLGAAMPSFFALIADPSLDVRRLALVTFNSAVLQQNAN